MHTPTLFTLLLWQSWYTAIYGSYPTCQEIGQILCGQRLIGELRCCDGIGSGHYAQCVQTAPGSAYGRWEVGLCQNAAGAAWCAQLTVDSNGFCVDGLPVLSLSSDLADFSRMLKSGTAADLAGSLVSLRG
jgi:hypothetical protein